MHESNHFSVLEPFEQKYWDILLLWFWSDKFFISHLNRSELINLALMMDLLNLDIKRYALIDDSVEQLRLVLSEEMEHDDDLKTQFQFIMLPFSH